MLNIDCIIKCHMYLLNKEEPAINADSSYLASLITYCNTIVSPTFSPESISVLSEVSSPISISLRSY